MKKMLAAMLAVLLAASPMSVLPAAAAPGQGSADVLHTWYRMILELARHTPTYSPPVASRAFAYLGVTAYSTVAAVRTSSRRLRASCRGSPPFRTQGRRSL